MLLEGQQDDEESDNLQVKILLTEKQCRGVPVELPSSSASISLNNVPAALEAMENTRL